MLIKKISDTCKSLFVCSLLTAISGCAVNYPHPDTVVLEQPKPGESLIYFLRAPHDNEALVIESSEKRTVRLPPESYVALSLPPGNYQFTTRHGGFFSTAEGAEKIEVSLAKNSRRFFHISGIEENRPSYIGFIGTGFTPLYARKPVVINRVWKECSELDARGLITISRRVHIE